MYFKYKIIYLPGNNRIVSVRKFLEALHIRPTVSAQICTYLFVLKLVTFTDNYQYYNYYNRIKTSLKW